MCRAGSKHIFEILGFDIGVVGRRRAGKLLITIMRMILIEGSGQAAMVSTCSLITSFKSTSPVLI